MDQGSQGVFLQTNVLKFVKVQLQVFERCATVISRDEIDKIYISSLFVNDCFLSRMDVVLLLLIT